MFNECKQGGMTSVMGEKQQTLNVIYRHMATEEIARRLAGGQLSASAADVARLELELRAKQAREMPSEAPRRPSPPKASPKREPPEQRYR
jgi:hypothetical protein